MPIPALRFLYVGISNDINGTRRYCPEPDCGRAKIPFAAAGDAFRIGGKTIKSVNDAEPDLMSATPDFDSEQQAASWLATADGQEFLESFQLVVLIRAHK